MLPQILQQFNAPAMANMQQAFKAMRGDPMTILQRLSNSPQMNEVQQLVNAAGGDARKAFYDLAAKRGVDPEQILSMFR